MDFVCLIGCLLAFVFNLPTSSSKHFCILNYPNSFSQKEASSNLLLSSGSSAALPLAVQSLISISFITKLTNLLSIFPFPVLYPDCQYLT